VGTITLKPTLIPKTNLNVGMAEEKEDGDIYGDMGALEQLQREEDGWQQQDQGHHQEDHHKEAAARIAALSVPALQGTGTRPHTTGETGSGAGLGPAPIDMECEQVCNLPNIYYQTRSAWGGSRPESGVLKKIPLIWVFASPVHESRGVLSTVSKMGALASIRR